MHLSHLLLLCLGSLFWLGLQSGSGLLLFLGLLLHLDGCVGIHEAAVLVPLLGLPLAGAALELLDLHGLEGLCVAVVPLEYVLHARGFLLELEHLLPPELGLELGKVLLDEVELHHVLDRLLL